MALTKTLAVASFSAAAVDPNVDPEVKTLLENYMVKYPQLFGITQQDEFDRAEAFLNKDPATWTVDQVQKAVVWLRDNWEDIPA